MFALGISGCKPGFSLPDGRVVPTKPDNLTIATVQFPLPPLLTGNIGTLNAFDEAIVTLDLNRLGAAVKGFRLHAAALTIDPAAPSGIGQVANPLLFVLD